MIVSLKHKREEAAKTDEMKYYQARNRQLARREKQNKDAETEARLKAKERL